MKKFLIISVVLFPLTSLAGSISTYPTTISVSPGQTLTLTVSVDPQGAAYTAKVNLLFPANLLSVVSFSQAPGWLSLSQPGYDFINNTGGNIIKTAGFPGGFSSPKVFGTITFKALAAGTATITVNSASQVLDAQNVDTLHSESGSTIVIVAAKPVAPVAKPQPKPIATTTATSTRVWLATSTATSTVSTVTPNQANVANSAIDTKNSLGLGIALIASALTFFLGFATGRLRAR